MDPLYFGSGSRNDCAILELKYGAIKHPDYPKGVFLNRDLPWKEIAHIIANTPVDYSPTVSSMHKKAAIAYRRREFTRKPICYRAMMDLIGNGTYYQNRPPWLPARASLDSRVREKCAKLAVPRWTRKKHPMFAEKTC